jgi:hypothetical protein
MKAFLGATLAALLLSGSAMAATLGQPANPAPVGLEIASTVSTPYTYGNGDSQAAPTFNYEDSVPVNASVTSAAHRAPALRDSTLNLVNQTGGGR